VSTRLAITTIVRGAPLGVPSGYLRIVDLDSGAQHPPVPLPDAHHRARDTNPRGGLRGGRGIAATADRLAVAVNDRILVLDRGWQLCAVLSHRWMGGLHDLAADEAGIWATCADNDLLLRLDWDGRLRDHWHWRTDRRLRRGLGHGWLPKFERWTDHRDPLGGGLRIDFGHLNAVAIDGDRLLVGLGMVRTPASLWWPLARERGLRAATRVGLNRPAQAAVARWRASPAAAIGRRQGHGPSGPATLELEPEGAAPGGWTWALVELSPNGRRPRATLVARHPCGPRPAHNAVPCGDLVAVNDSPGSRVLGVDRRTGQIARSVALPGEFRFPRGLVRLADGRLVVGTQLPASLQIVDLERERIDECLLLDDDRGEATYALAAVPEGFADPAGRLGLERLERVA
jgi:hypothetical protein